MAISRNPVLLDSPEPGFGFGAHLPHPCGRAALQFRVVLILPGAGGGLEGLALPASLNLLAGHLGEKRAPPRLPTRLSIPATTSRAG